MKNYIIVKADTNDADYNTSINEISDENLETVKIVIEAIKKCKIRHNWAVSEYSNKSELPIEVYKGILTLEQIDIMNEYIPYGEDGIHTICSIKIISGDMINLFQKR